MFSRLFTAPKNTGLPERRQQNGNFGRAGLSGILDHLNALRFFEAVARLGSVRNAAAELSVTDGAVSKQIRALEAVLDVELFIRAHRKLILTEDAARLYETLNSSFDAISRAAEQVRSASERNSIVIAAPSTFLVRWLLPRLSGLEQRAKGAEVSVLTWNKDLAASDRSIDMHVVVGPEEEVPGMTRHALAPETFGPVVRSSDAPPDGSEAEVLNLRHLNPAWPPGMWRNWAAESGQPLGDAPVMNFERLLFAIQAAEAGMGTVLAPGPAVWDSMAAGTLSAPLGLHRRDGSWGLMWRTDQTSGLHMSILRWFQQEFDASRAAAGCGD
jgi:DNA-binding transcriptional LysR family regulator